MRVLWITNVLLPEIAVSLGYKEPVIGGWMHGLARQLGDMNDIKLAIASTDDSGSTLITRAINGTTYYVLPNKSGKPENLQPHWITVCNDFKPDIIHIHGTEFPKALMCMRACPDEKYLLSIQGLTSVIARYHYADISMLDVLKNVTVRDILRLDTIVHGKKFAERNGDAEREYFLRAKHVIGRTTWDYAHSMALNPKIQYHFCNESLRDKFYMAPKWNVNEAEKFTIFVSQSERTIKGLHKLLEAINILKDEFPLVKIKVSGGDITKTSSLKDRLKQTGYGSIIKKIITQNKLEKHVDFVGRLTADQMIEMYRKSHVFVCPSSIENSSNSLAEAQLLGVPSIASFVGGAPDMITHGKDGLLYRFEEFEMMALFIKQVFTDEKLAQQLSENAIKTAEKRHNRSENLTKLISIYSNILNG